MYLSYFQCQEPGVIMIIFYVWHIDKHKLKVVHGADFFWKWRHVEQYVDMVGPESGYSKLLRCLF